MKAFWLAMVVCLVSASAQAAPVLVDTDWLSKQLEDAKTRVVVVDMSDDDIQYQRFHIPGAVRVPYGVLLKRPGPGKPAALLSEAELAKLLGSFGITREAHVVAYDDMGGLNAARLFWELERIGHPEVSVLNGGLVKWVLERRPVEAAAVKPRAVAYQPVGKGRGNLATREDVAHLAMGHGGVLLDVRSREEYAGDPKEKRSGHIPHAALLPWDDTVNWQAAFMRDDATQVQQRFVAAGVDAKTPVVTYCRSGHRAAHSYLTLRSLGHDDVRVYMGSMLDWLQDKDAALKLGKEP